MSKFNKDILSLLFEELQDDLKSLFSCLMVNKLWCETVIPVLWKNPWHSASQSSLYNIITFYLADDVKKFLTNQGIQLPSTSTSHKSLLFDYLSFCRSINVNIMNNIISIIGSSSDYKQFLLQQEIYSLLIRKCSEIKNLNIISLKHQIFYFPEARFCLESLCELKCDTYIDPSYFYGLTRICQGIQRVIIINNNPKANKGIVKLIEVQSDLKYFEWKDDFNNVDDDDFFIEDSYETFFALTKNAKNIHVLNHFIADLQSVDDFERILLQNVLPELYKLKTLKIDTHGVLDDPLKKLVFHDLEVLRISEIDVNMSTCIIKNSGGNLREISLDYRGYLYEDEFYHDSLTLIRAIYENCPLVECLSLIFSSSKKHFIEFEKLLKVCQKLKSLTLIIMSNKEISSVETGERLLTIFIRLIPTKLREIEIVGHFKFSLEILEKFLENRRGRPAISILASGHTYGVSDYIELINKYKNDGVIKDIGHDFEVSKSYFKFSCNNE